MTKAFKVLSNSFLFAFCFFLLLPVSAFAQAERGPFDFQVSSKCTGCVTFSDFYSNFALIPTGTPVRLRLYYASDYGDHATETSQYLELPITMNYQTGQAELPDITFGNWSSGTRYTFAYGLVSENGNLLWFMKPSEFDETRHTVDVN